jgi:hypothetical protein
MIESRKSEIRYRTDDPKKMLGKWLSKSVTKSWTETFKDEERKVIAAIEQVKPIPISRYIPLEFSMVYNEEK